MERRFGHQHQRVRLLLRHRRRIVFPRALAVEHLARGVECPHQQRAGLRREPSPNDHRTVVVRMHLEAARDVLTLRLVALRAAVDTTPAPDDALDVVRRPRARQLQQTLFGVWGGHAGNRTDLGIRDLAATEGRPQQRQVGQRPCHPHLLARPRDRGPRANSATRRTSGSRCSSPRARRTRGCDPAAARWRLRGVRTARRFRLPGARSRHSRPAWRSPLLVGRLYAAVFEAPARHGGRRSRAIPAPFVPATRNACHDGWRRGRKSVLRAGRNHARCASGILSRGKCGPDRRHSATRTE